MQPVRLVLVEDMPMEAEIAIRQLESGGFSCNWKRVDSEAAAAPRRWPRRARPDPLRFHAARLRRHLRARDRARGLARDAVHIPLGHASAKSAPSMPCSAARTTTCSRPTWRAWCPRCAARSTMRPSAARASRSSSSCATSSSPRRTGSGSTIATANSRSAATRCASTLGYAPEEMLGTNASQYVHPEDLAALDFAMHTLGRESAHGHQPAGALAPSQRQLSLARTQHAGVAGRATGRSRASAAASAISPNAAGRKNTSAA